MVELIRKFKKEVNKVKDAILYPLTLPGLDIDISAKAKLKAEIELVLDESFLALTDRIGYLIEHSKQSLNELMEQAIGGLSNLLTEVENIVDKFLENFNPDAIREKLINPLFENINKLEKELFKDLDKLIEKIDTVFTGTIEDAVNDIKKLTDVTIFFNPLDQCRKEHDIPVWRIGTSLSDIDYYNLVTCHLLKRLDEKDTLDNITDVYSSIQQAAWKMTCVLRGAPQARQKIFKDWTKYGQLIDLWSKFPMTMTPLEAAEEAVKKLESARLEFIEKAQKIDDLDTATKAAQNAANNAISKADAAQSAANTAATKADAAQNTANQASNKVQKINFDGTKTIINSPLLIDIPSASGFKTIPLEISVGSFKTVENLKNSFYILTKDVGSGKPYDKVIKP
jgi:hypothetical protein